MVWISTVRGLTRLNPQTRSLQNFDAADGLQSEFNIGACAQGADGTLYLGGPEGYHAFAPAVHRAPSPTPPMQFTELVMYEPTKAYGTATRDAVRTGERDRSREGHSAGVSRQVLEPFFRVPGDAAAPGDVRAGLGLATARRIVLLHGGDICAGNARGGGAIVTFTLPLTSSEITVTSRKL